MPGLCVEKYYEAWSSQWTCTEMHSRNDSFVEDCSWTIEQVLQAVHHKMGLLCEQEV